MPNALAKASFAKAFPVSQTFVTLTQFGAIGGSVATAYAALPDDTAAIQAAIDFCKANNVALHLDGRRYRFTRSLNFGKANAKDGRALRVIGSQRFSTTLIADLAEAWPAMDFTNQGRGLLENVLVTSTTTSLHTCMILLGETVQSGTNLFTFHNVEIQDLGAASRYAVFGLTSDQISFVLCNIMAAGGAAVAAVRFGYTNPDAIASKWYALTAQMSDLTMLSGMLSNFLCGTGPGYWAVGYTTIALSGCYAGVIGIGGHTMGAFRFGSGSRQTQPVLDGCRTEDNAQLAAVPLATFTGSIVPTGDNMTSTLTVTATSTGALAVGQLLSGGTIAAGTLVLAQVDASTWLVGNIQTVASTAITATRLSGPAVYVEDAIYEGKFSGAFLSSGGGFGGPGSHWNSTVNAFITYGAFQGAGPLYGGTFHFSGGTNTIGYFAASASREFRIGGRIGSSAATLFPLLGAVAAEITDLYSDGTYMPHRTSAQTSVYFPAANSPTNYRFAVKGDAGSITLSATTGGSLQPILSQSFSPGMLAWQEVSAAYLAYPQQTIVIEGQFNSAWAASGQIALNLTQALSSGTTKSTGNVSLTGIPAWGAAVGFRIELAMYRGSGTSWSCRWRIETEGSAPVSNGGRFNLGALNFDVTDNSTFTVNVLALNSAANPLDTAAFYRVV